MYGWGVSRNCGAMLQWVWGRVQDEGQKKEKDHVVITPAARSPPSSPVLSSLAPLLHPPAANNGQSSIICGSEGRLDSI